MSNWEKVAVAADSLKGVISDKTKALKESINEIDGGAAALLLKAIGGKASSFLPVYKIMITTPSNTGKPIRHILADTSRPGFVNWLNSSDSPVLGIWIDHSDLTEPDKAIILIQNPLSYESGIFEQDIVNFPQFGVRNWLDIWIGYKPVGILGTGGGSLLSVGRIMEELGLSGLGDLARKAGVNINEVPLTVPDNFFFGSDTHLFSGPVVSVKRIIATKGDRLQIIGFSPVINLRGKIARKFTIKHGRSVLDAVGDVVDAVVLMKEPEEIKNTGLSEYSFYLGIFEWNMFAGSYLPRYLRVDPLHNDIKPSFTTYKDPLYVDPFGDSDLIKEKMQGDTVKKNTGFTRGDFTAEKMSLYDVLAIQLTEPTYHGLSGLGLSIRPAPSYNPMQAFTDGRGHPGVYLRYGYKFEIEGMLYQWKIKNRYKSSIAQVLTLGKDARELECGIEYGTVFNTRWLVSKGTCSDDPEEVTSMKFPTSECYGPRLKRPPFNKQIRFWNHLLDDIHIHGESIHPVQSWIWGEGDAEVDPGLSGLHDPVTQVMREGYFAGMSGSVYSVGNPSVAPGRLLKIKDERDTVSSLVSSVARKALKKVREFGPLKKYSYPETVLNLKGVTTTQYGGDKYFYIWKTRHYLGVRSGYVTKTYFLEERNRAWKQQTSSIDDIIKAALAQAREMSRQE